MVNGQCITQARDPVFLYSVAYGGCDGPEAIGGKASTSARRAQPGPNSAQTGLALGAWECSGIPPKTSESQTEAGFNALGAGKVVLRELGWGTGVGVGLREKVSLC